MVESARVRQCAVQPLAQRAGEGVVLRECGWHSSFTERVHAPGFEAAGQASENRRLRLVNAVAAGAACSAAAGGAGRESNRTQVV